MFKLAPLAFVLALVGLSFIATPGVAADDKVDVSGTWDFAVDIGGNQGTPSFTFKQEGEKLTGKYKGQFGEADVKGTVKDKEIEFSFELDGGNKVTYSGTIEKDAMKGKADYAGQAQGTWTAKRKK